MGGGTRALGADGAFLDLQNDLAAGRIFLGDIFLGNSRGFAAFAFALDDFVLFLKVSGQDVPVVEEGVFFNADVHESGLEAIFQIADFAFVNTGHNALIVVAFHGEVLKSVGLHDADACFEALGADDDFPPEGFLGMSLRTKRLTEAMMPVSSFLLVGALSASVLGAGFSASSFTPKALFSAFRISAS